MMGLASLDPSYVLIKPQNELTNRKQIIGTGFGMSDSDIEVVKDQLLSFYGPPTSFTAREKIILENKHKCTDVFDYYAKSLPA